MPRVNRATGGEAWRTPELGICACTQIRKTTRAVTAFYDQHLAVAGLTVTQYAILVNIGRAEQLSRTALAARLGMDRTTLTRNLQPLERAGLLHIEPGADRREHAVRLSKAGHAKLNEAYPCWEKAQRQFLAAMGDEGITALRVLLADAAEAAIENDPSA